MHEDEAVNPTTDPRQAAHRRSHWRRFLPLYLLLAVCTAPVVASYLAYYVLPPGGRTNYGDLVMPQRPAPALTLRTLDGAPFDFASLRGQWVMLMADSAACSEPCERHLWTMRQLRAATGKDRDRIERVFLLLDDAPVDPRRLREYEGTLFLRADRAEIERFLALPETPDAQHGAHLWMIDPLGNQMMRWPAQADPNRIKRDLGKLLKASRIG